MPPAPFWKRLRETRLVQVLVVYLAGAWVAIQAMALFADAFQWPLWVMRGTIVLLAAALVATLVVVGAQTRGRAEEGAPPARSRPLLAGALALSLAVVGAALWFVVHDRGRSLPPTVAEASAAPGIAILPFTVNDPELGPWREGMVDALSMNLDGAAGLRAIDGRTVLARWRERVGEGATADLPTALGVAEASGGRYALVGSVVSSGTNMRVLADLYDLREDARFGREQVEGSPDSIFALVDRLSIAVLRRIVARQEGALVPRVDLASITTTSLPALKAFLEGEALARRSAFEDAIPAYDRALEADSAFALAAYRLAEAYGWMEGLDAQRVDSLVRRASRFANRLPERDRDELATVLAYTRPDPDATERARALARKYPDDPHAWYLLGEVYFHLPYQSLVSREETADPFRRATSLDPTYTPAYIHLLDLAMSRADSAGMAEVLTRYHALAAGTRYGLRYTLLSRLMFGPPAARQDAIATLDTLPAADAAAVLHYLHHPRFLALQESLLRAHLERPDVAATAREELLGVLIQRGKLGEATTLLTDPELSLDARTGGAFLLMAVGAPLPDGLYERVFADGMEAMDSRLFGVALLAVERRRWAEYAAAEERAARMLEQVEARGDSLTARQVEDGIRVVRARRALVRGRNEEALPLLEAAYRRSGFLTLPLWIARLHADAGHAAEAERYLETYGADPWIAAELARFYEERGEPEKALEAYGWITLAWDGADAELQPKVAEARRAIARLKGLQRG